MADTTDRKRVLMSALTRVVAQQERYITRLPNGAPETAEQHAQWTLFHRLRSWLELEMACHELRETVAAHWVRAAAASSPKEQRHEENTAHQRSEHLLVRRAELAGVERDLRKAGVTFGEHHSGGAWPLGVLHE